MQNFDIYKFTFDNFRSSNGCNSALQKNQNYAEDAHSLTQLKL